MELSLRDVARLLDVSDDTVSRWIRQGDLPASHVRGEFRVNKVDLQEWAATRDMRVSEELFAPEGDIEQLPSLYQALLRGQIHYDIAGAQRDDVLAALARLPTIPNTVDRHLLLELMVSREQLSSTGIGAGIAIPHPRDPLVVHIAEPIVILAFARQPIDFAAIDSVPVHTLFVVLSPNVRAHLQILSRLMFALHDEAVRTLLQDRAAAGVILSRIRELEKAISTPR